MAETVRFPLDQVVQFDAMATVDTTLWQCRICGQHGTARTTPQATDDAIAHLGIDHGGVRDCASERKRIPCPTAARAPLPEGGAVSGTNGHGGLGAGDPPPSGDPP